MDQFPQSPTAERSYPIGIVVLPAFLGALLWLIAMIGGY